MEVVRHVIDGAEVDSASGRTFASHDPATGAQLADVAFGEAEDVARAVAAAHRADRWAGVAPAERAAALRRVAAVIREHADELASLESADSGKPIAQAAGEIESGAQLFETFSGLPELPAGRVHPAADGYFVYSRREPYGVVGAIAPWNFPFVLACWKVAPALAVGNRVVLKMAEQTPLTAARLGLLCLEAGMPDGVLNVVNGDGTTGHELVVHPRVPKITFTGSTAVGREILRDAAAQVKSVHLELGGKTPNLVFEDAPRDEALAGSLFTSFHNAGQICTTGSRLLVDERIADEFTEALVRRASALPVGNPRDAATKIGPLVSAEQLERVSGYVQAGLDDGATLLCGGGPPAGVDGGGHYLAPTVFGGVRPGMRIAQEEIFGPVLSVLTFADEDAAVELANDVMYGLAATVWTSDLGRAFRLADRLEAGIVWTNCPHFLPYNVPYEGHKQSGLGEDLGVEAASTFTKLKTHLVGHSAPPPRMD